jgi:hypothetical protein
MVLDLIKGFFCIYWDDQVGFVFASVNVVYYIYWFVYVEPPLHSWDEAYLVVVNDCIMFWKMSPCQNKKVVLPKKSLM